MPFLRASETDNTRAFVRKGFRFIGNRGRAPKSDGFRTPIMLRPVTCAMGEDATAHFHDGEHFTRVGAMPERFSERRSTGFDLVPHGAGDRARDHRGPGGDITIEMIRRAFAALLETRYASPSQPLDVPLNRFPTLPRSGMVLEVQ